MKKLRLLSVPSNIGSSSDTAPSSDAQNGPAALLSAHSQLYQGFEVEQVLEAPMQVNAEETVEDLLLSVHSATLKLLQQEGPFAVLGGAHTLSLATLRALRDVKGSFSLLYFDAHPDIMPHEEINYGTTIFHALEEGVLDPRQLFYVGIRQIEIPEREEIERRGIAFIDAAELSAVPLPEVVQRIRAQLTAPMYMSIDIDALDPAFAPGVSTPCPGGISPQQLVYLARAFCSPELIGFEIVELSPGSDRDNQTATFAGHLLQELARACTR